MSKPVPPASSRQTRKAAVQARQASALPTPALVVIAILVGLAIIVGLAVFFTIQDRQAATAPIEGVQQFPGQERGHVPEGVTITYDPLPPVGGRHYATWQNCGIYTEPIRNEYAVHSLEHGAVWITYHPDLPADQVAVLQSKVRGREYALLSPFPGLTSPVVASAWGLQLQLDDANDPRLDRFLRRYLQGPQTPEPGAACFGGVGDPQ
ncbi:MAG: DUF3105 domain-containing protein [Anaerolineales bacterium]|nr:DUF3105 domain-containing protein [Anaerolineales bacterium]